MSLGADPFYGQVNLEVINLVLNGNVLSKPDNCPATLYDHMLQCWSRFPEIRPTFSDVCRKMEEFVEASNNAESPFSGPYIYRVPIGGSTIPSESTPTVGEPEWRRGNDGDGSALHINDSRVNLIHSNSLSMARCDGGSSSGSGVTSRLTRSLQRQVSCSRPAVDPGAPLSPGFFFTQHHQQQQQPPLPSPLYAHEASPTDSLARRGAPGLRRQLSDRYQYNRDPEEVDSMGYERPALMMTGPYFNTLQQGYRRASSPARQYAPRSPPHYAIPARPPLTRDTNYGIMHHSLYVGSRGNQATNQGQTNNPMFQSAQFHSHTQMESPRGKIDDASDLGCSVATLCAAALSSRTVVSSESTKLPVEFQDDFVKKLVSEELITIPDFITEEEEQSLLSELDPILSRSRYQTSHWDNAIEDFRETERKNWRAPNRLIIDRLRQKTLDVLKEEPRPEGAHKASSFDDLLPYIHVLDLAPTGWIKPHVDSIRYCGGVVAVLSLLADSIARFTVAPESEVAPSTSLLPASRMDLALPPPGASTDVWVRRRMLYIMRGATRYRLTHAILPNDSQIPGTDRVVHRDRRITVMCRPRPERVPLSQPGGGSYSYGQLS
ncbi:Alkylated DNA repair protein AlkB [Echinococcus granulosus]|uniref:Alkylated DNA repair protein AlkB n=1 Tax=Echinococcus granulosus TaxID=6210 RepID=W6V9A8_ECHGR|nr:Alkylated DNA repair protein AlkB [Echinococcus granulosus]EUB63164.1 Alkylated DNA repair protein AlkB [Echinococcus granulosus]